MNIVKLIKDSMDKMTKSEYAVATYCLGNLNDFAFDTLDVVAGKIGTSTTSVIRFCRRLGFDGYKPFQESLRSGFKYQQSLPDKFKRTVKANVANHLLEQTVIRSMNCLEKTFDELPYERLYEAASLISGAKRLYSFGMRESFALAHYAYTRFLTVRDNVYMLTAGFNGEFESLIGMSDEDVCIVYLFHRYTKQALQVIKVLRDKGVKIILITSPPIDAVSGSASVLLPCYVDVNSIKNSSVAPVCLTDYLCNAAAVAGGDTTLSHMKKSEKLFEDFSVLGD